MGEIVILKTQEQKRDECMKEVLAILKARGADRVMVCFALANDKEMKFFTGKGKPGFVIAIHQHLSKSILPACAAEMGITADSPLETLQ